MVVDDSALSRRILRVILESAGHTLLEESDGLSAIEHYFLNKPDCVFLDMTMQGMNGLDVLIQLKKIDPHAKVIIGSADIQLSTKENVRAHGASGFIEKPFTPEKVFAILNPLLEMA